MTDAAYQKSTNLKALMTSSQYDVSNFYCLIEHKRVIYRQSSYRKVNKEAKSITSYNVRRQMAASISV
jgi:hypothetical protein